MFTKLKISKRHIAKSFTWSFFGSIDTFISLAKNKELGTNKVVVNLEDYDFEESEAYFLATQAGRMRIGNMVDPKYTLGASILKEYIKK